METKRTKDENDNYYELLEKAKLEMSEVNAAGKSFSLSWIKAKEFIDKAIEVDPNHPFAYFNKAMFLSKIDFGLYYPLDEMANKSRKFKNTQNTFDTYLKNVSKPEDIISAYSSILKAIELEPLYSDLYQFVNLFFVGYEKDYHKGKPQEADRIFSEDQIERFAKLLARDIKPEGDLNEQIELLKSIYDVLSNIALRYRNRTILQSLIKYCNLLLPLDEGNRNVYLREKVVAIYYLESPKNGCVAYQELLKDNPRFSENVVQGMLKNDQWKFIKNSVSFVKAISNTILLDPEFSYGYYMLARIIEYNYPSGINFAMEHYEKAAILQNGQSNEWISDCLFNLSRLLSINGRYADALVRINEAIKTKLSSSRYYLEKGRILKASGKVFEAYEEFEQAQRLAKLSHSRWEEDYTEEITKEKEEMLRYFGQQIMQDQVDKLKQVLAYDSTADLKRDMVKIESDPILKDYFDQFVFNFSSLYTTSQIILSGQINLDTSNLWADLGAKALSLIPLYGSAVSSLFSAVSTQLIAADMKNKARNFCKLASNQERISVIATFLARKIVLCPVKKRRLKEATRNKKTIKDPFWQSVDKAFSKFKTVAGFDDYQLRSNTPSAKIALEDASFLISEIIKDEDLVHLQEERRNEDIIDLFFKLEEEKLNKDRKKNKSKGFTSKDSTPISTAQSSRSKKEIVPITPEQTYIGKKA